MNVLSVHEAQAWYKQWFGAKGGAFDRIGLEVKNVEDFCRRMEASGHNRGEVIPLLRGERFSVPR